MSPDARRIDYGRARLRDLDERAIKDEAATSLGQSGAALFEQGFLHFGRPRLRVEWSGPARAWHYSFEIWCYRRHDEIARCASAAALQERIREQIRNLMASLPEAAA